MKKLLIAAVVVFSMGAYLKAEENLNVPSAELSNPIGSDYGGVEVATSVFSAAVSTVNLIDFSTRTVSRDFNVIYGADFSTGACGDFIDVFVSTGGFVDAGASRFRVYNIVGSTGAIPLSSGQCGGSSEFRWPRRLKGNVFFQPNVDDYNRVTFLYWRERRLVR